MSLLKFTRRNFIKSAGIISTPFLFSGLFNSCAKKTEQPNILWITSEDNSPFFGCYGDEFATTPHFDRFATEGILYENAFANAPVCAPARNGIITGMYPPSLGTQHMRSHYHVPGKIHFFPRYLREAGYYCTNNSKQDYNVATVPEGIWDESSKTATYKNRAPGQPFFAVFNLGVSHESSIHKTLTDLRHDPQKVTLPDYHPDTPEIRHDWAQYYDKVEDLDRQFGALLQELEDAGLAGDTIVFYYSDHGGILARSKRFCYDSGLHVPFLMRFPKKYQHLAPERAGSRTDRIVTFVDLPPTVLSLAGVPIPAHFQGKAFLGEQEATPRKYAFSFRGRMDERYDMMRTVRNKQFRYIRNYLPFRIYGQHLQYLWRAPSARSWEKMYRAGKCNAVQSAFWQPKPAEELYDLKNDPYEIHNLADDPEYAAVLEELQQACTDWQMEIHDTGFIPEGEMVRINERTTLHDYVRSAAYDLPRILEAAGMAASKNPENLPKLLKLLGDRDKFVRYWAATGCLALGATEAAPELEKLLTDPCPDIRIVAAEALCLFGETGAGLAVLEQELVNENRKVALRSANALEALDETARPALKALIIAAASEDEYVPRAAKYTVSKLQDVAVKNVHN